MKRKVLSIMLAAAMLGTTLVGCGANGDAKESKGSDKNSITVLVESGSPAEALAKSTEPWFVERVYAKLIEKLQG